MSPLRCHLLIGPPGSGKTTMSKLMAPLLNAEVLSTDFIRKELYGDETCQGEWSEIENRLHSQLKEFVNQGKSVLIDATHAKRPWRLSYTQRIELSQPVEWIGWWMKTPLDICLDWNASRNAKVPEELIHRFNAALSHKYFCPERAEGFSVVVEFDPSLGTDIENRFKLELARLEKRISSSRNKEREKDLHGYSRLVDLERLLYLVQLLTRYPGLCATDSATRRELEGICNPLPEGSMSERAAAFLSSLHGHCYSDRDALNADLDWLEAQGFFKASPSNEPIKPPPIHRSAELNLGGWPSMADKQIFVRRMTLLRHVIQNPFDHAQEVPLREHLINQLSDVYMPGEASTLRKDVEELFTPYGFRDRRDNVRHGHGIGVAVLPASRLRDVHHVITQAVTRLGDPTAELLQGELEERLRWGGLLGEKDKGMPLRVFANRSIVHPDLIRPDSLANPKQAERLEEAIASNHRVVLERFSAAAQFENSYSKDLHIWPLQLIFHNIGWYLAFEEDTVGQERGGLIRTERLDRLALRQVDKGLPRPSSARANAVERLNRLLEISGGIYFGEDVNAQFNISNAGPSELSKQLLTVRFRCTEQIYRFLREGLQRYPINQLRISKPLAEDRWKSPSRAPLVLDPELNNSHPFPIEIDLPSWTVGRDIDFRRWLFGFGSGIVIEKPLELKEECCSIANSVRSLYQD